MDDPILLIEDDGPVRLLTLNRPDKRNALSMDLIQQLHEAFDEAIRDQTVRALILTGAGASFCSGLDLKEVQASRTDPKLAQQGSDRVAGILQRIYHCPKPVIAAVNGAAVAGGAGLMSVCDLVLGAESAKIGYPEIKRGLIAAIVMTYLVRHVGERRAKYLLMTGETISAHEALAFGLISAVVPDEQLRLRALELAHKLAEYAPQALTHTKELLYEIQTLSPEDGMEKVRRVHTQMRTTTEAADAINAFLNRKQK